jgi:SHS2 domain-containing protein
MLGRSRCVLGRPPRRAYSAVVYHLEERSSEIELLIEDVDAERIFAEALLALGDVFADAAAAPGTPVTHEVEVRASDLPTLLAEWIRELVYLAEAEGFVPERITKLRLAGTSLSAEVAGERSIPRSLIRALAYDRVEMEQLEDGTWTARVVLDT